MLIFKSFAILFASGLFLLCVLTLGNHLASSDIESLFKSALSWLFMISMVQDHKAVLAVCKI